MLLSQAEGAQSATSEYAVGYRPLVLFLSIAFGVGWGIAIVYVAFSKALIPLIGQLTLTHPLTILALYAPSLAGVVVYYVYGGWKDLAGLAGKLIPARTDARWYLTVVGIFGLFYAYMRVGSIVFHQVVPPITMSAPAMLQRALWTLIEETGLIGGLFGWIGFLLPFLQRMLRNSITAAALTGLIFGLWVLPGYLISSVNQTDTSYLLYVTQLVAFIVFASFFFNDSKGNLLLYVIAFWLAAIGSHIQLYYFTRATQVLEIVFFVMTSIILAVVMRANRSQPLLQVYPDFVRL